MLACPCLTLSNRIAARLPASDVLGLFSVRTLFTALVQPGAGRERSRIINECLFLHVQIYIYKDFSINWSFFVVALNFVLLTLSSFVVSVYNKTPPQRRSHSRVFTPPSPARGGGGAQFCYPSGVGPDLAEGRGVVPRCSVPILGLPSGVARGPAGPTDRGWGPLSRADRATDPGLGCKCIMAAPH
jgi:hypothetical protein